MISRCEKLPGEFPDYIAYFVPDYAAEISSNYDLDTDESLTRAEREVLSDLEFGVDTQSHELL